MMLKWINLTNARVKSLHRNKERKYDVDEQRNKYVDVDRAKDLDNCVWIADRWEGHKHVVSIQQRKQRLGWSGKRSEFDAKTQN
jgi:hypothetical protein